MGWDHKKLVFSVRLVDLNPWLLDVRPAEKKGSPAPHPSESGLAGLTPAALRMRLSRPSLPPAMPVPTEARSPAAAPAELGVVRLVALGLPDQVPLHAHRAQPGFELRIGADACIYMYAL